MYNGYIDVQWTASDGTNYPQCDQFDPLNANDMDLFHSYPRKEKFTIPKGVTTVIIEGEEHRADNNNDAPAPVAAASAIARNCNITTTTNASHPCARRHCIK